MRDIYKGELVRLSAMNAEEIGKAFARWSRDSEYRRLLDSGVSSLPSAKAAQTWLEKELEEGSVNQRWFSIRKLDDDQLLGDVDLYVYNWSARDAFVGLGIGEREFWGKGYGRRRDARHPALRLHRSQPEARYVDRVRVQPARHPLG